MSPLRQALADYLSIRRALGYKLERAEKLLHQYLDHVDRLGEERVSIENAVGWAKLPATGNGHWWAFRLSVVRGFAAYLHALDPAHEVPPADLLPNRVHRAIPYLYSQEEIVALMAATGSLRFPLRQATYRTLIGLLSVTGMRVGEAIRLDQGDVDLGQGVLTVGQTKFGKTRELPLHRSTVEALRAYMRLRDRLCPTPVTDAALISPAGTRLLYTNVSNTFLDLVDRAGLPRPATGRRPRLHDFRHAFAVRTLLEWYRAGLDV
ncbi:MAG: tyrosine-type recombinase/integrase, partial [Actinobacteria bacterium]|nr:tyrosine-type recombinase/integrase [Actinomycetota bacterium]